MLRDFNHPYLKEAAKSREGPSNFDLIKGLLFLVRQWQHHLMMASIVQTPKYSQIRIESRLFHALLLSSDVPAMLLNQPNDEVDNTLNYSSKQSFSKK